MKNKLINISVNGRRVFSDFVRNLQNVNIEIEEPDTSAFQRLNNRVKQRRAYEMVRHHNGGTRLPPEINLDEYKDKSMSG